MALAVMPKPEDLREPFADPGAFPCLSREAATARKLGRRQGSNPGGIYQSADGVKRYVKFYVTPSQAYCEAVANRVYYTMGHHAPRSSLVYEDSRVVGIANEWIENTGSFSAKGLTKTKARNTLDGYVTDVWLANWDAAGTGLDNLVTFRRGQGVYVARIDQGGSLLFRAQGARKSGQALSEIREWEGFADPAVNPYYAQLFDEAGLLGADDLADTALGQIRRIQKLRKSTNDFADLAPAAASVPEADRKAVLAILRKRAALLDSVIAPRVKTAKKAAKCAGIPGAMPSAACAERR